MAILKEFKTFVMRGNVIDLAVGVIIGGAFGKIVSSTVDDIIMPPVGLILGGVNFSDLFLALDGKDYPSLVKAKEAGAPVIAIGSFIQTCIQFIIIAFAIFMLVKIINTIKKGSAQVAPIITPQEKLLTEIRDILKKS